MLKIIIENFWCVSFFLFFFYLSAQLTTPNHFCEPPLLEKYIFLGFIAIYRAYILRDLQSDQSHKVENFKFYPLFEKKLENYRCYWLRWITKVIGEWLEIFQLNFNLWNIYKKIENSRTQISNFDLWSACVSLSSFSLVMAIELSLSHHLNQPILLLSLWYICTL